MCDVMTELYLIGNTMEYIIRLLLGKKFFLLVIFLTGIYNLRAQHDPEAGDFRSVTDGAWGEFGVWEVYNGSSWVPASETEVPGKDNSVYIQQFDDIILDTTAICKNLHLNKEAFLDLDTATLEVWGHLRFYDGGGLPGVNVILPPESPGKWIISEADGSLKFKGNTARTIVVPGSGGTSNGLTGYNAEVAFDESVEAVLEEDFRFGNLTISSGIFTVNAAHLFAGSTASLSGNIILRDSVVFNPPTEGIYRSAGLPMESFLLDTLATFNLGLDDLIIAAQDLKLSGTVLVEEIGLLPLALPTNGSIPGAEQVDTYYNLYIGGSTTKQLSSNVTINGLLTLTDAYFDPNGYIIAYGNKGGLEYAGNNPVLTTDFEFPAADGPFNLVISNPNVSLHDHRMIHGQLTLNGGILGLGNFDLTFGEESLAIAGDFSNTNFISIEGTGTLKKVFSQPGSFLFPIGERNGSTEYTPADVTINSGTFSVGSFLGVGLTENKHPNDISTDNYLSRYWSFHSTIDDLNISGALNYKTDDVSGLETSISTYYYDVNTAVALALIDYDEKVLSFASLDIQENDFEITGSNHCNIENNLITVINQDYCGSIDLDNIIGSVAIVSPMNTIDYQWEMRKDESVWTAIPGAIGKDFDPDLITDMGFYEFRRMAKTLACTQEHQSNIFSFTLYPDITDYGIQNASVEEFCISATGFSINGESPAGGDGLYSYQWERSKDEGTFASVGLDSVHYEEEEQLTPGTYQYRRGTISPTCGIFYSDTVIVNVYSEIADFSINADNFEYCDIPSEIIVDGETPTGGGPSLVYSWERQVNNGGFTAIGGNSEDLADDDISVTGEYQYRRSVVGAPCGIKNSNVITIYVRPALSPNTITKEEDIIYCGNATGYKLEGSAMSGGNGAFTYAWFRKKDSNTSVNLASNTVDYFEDDDLGPGVYKYYRKVISSVCITTSDTVSVTILPLIADNDITLLEQEEYCGLPASIAVDGSEPTGGDGSYVFIWERRIDNGAFEEVGTEQVLLDENITAPGQYEYRRKVISGTCSPDESNILTITIYPELSENKLSMASLDFCSEPTGFTIETLPMTGGDGNYASIWERSYDGGEFTTVKNFAAEDVSSFIDSFEETETLAPGNYSYRRIVSSVICADTSSLLEIVVQQPLSNNTLEQPEGLDAIFCGSTSALNITGSEPEGGSGLFEYRYERRHNGGDWIAITTSGKDLVNSGLDQPGSYDFRRVVYSTICYEIVSNIVSVEVTEPLVVNATIKEKEGLELNGSIELEVSGGLPPYSYFWTTTETTQNIYNLDAIEYRVVVTDQSGCEVTELYRVPQILGLKDSPHILSHKLYPNPVEDVLKIEVSLLKPLQYQIYIINNVGKVVKTISSKPANKIDMDIHMREYPAGIYFVKIATDNKTETWKFIKK